MQTIAETARAATALGRDAERIADALRHHLPDVADRRHHAALHRIEVAARDFANTIGLAEAALSPVVKAAIEAL